MVIVIVLRKKTERLNVLLSSLSEIYILLEDLKYKLQPLLVAI